MTLPASARRRYEESGDTFACRFYDRLAMGSPCEAGAEPAVVQVPGEPDRVVGMRCRRMVFERILRNQFFWQIIVKI